MEIFSVMASMSLVDMITAPLRRIAGQMNVTDKAAASLSSGALALSKSLLPIALAAGVLLAALAPCISTAAEFESAMAGVGAVSRATPAEMRELSDAARELGATTAWSAMQVAEGQKYLAMAGFSVKENVAALPAVLNLASAGATDLGRAADISSDILSAFNLEARDMGRVSDTLAATFTSSNTSLEMLGETMKYVAPVANRAGLSIEETAAMAGLLGNIGIKSSMAGTSLKAMLNGLSSPSSEAAQKMKDLGIETRDATGNLLHPIAILETMSEKMAGMGSAEQMAFIKTVSGSEAMASALELVAKAGAGVISEYTAQVTGAGTAAEIAARQNDNFVGDTKALGSALESVQITIGSVFLPAMRAMAQATTWVVRGLDMIAASPVGKFLLSAAAILSVAVIAVTLLSGAVWAGTAAWAALNAAIFANPLGLIVLVVVALGAAFVALYRRCRPVQDFFADLGEVLGIISYEIEREFLVAWFEIKRTFDKILQPISALWRELGDLFSLLGGSSSEIEQVSSFWQDLGYVLGSVVSGAFKMLAAGIEMALFPLKLVLTTVTTFIDLLQGEISLAEAGKKLVMTFVDGIVSVASKPYEAVTGVLKSVRNLLPFSDAKEGPLSSLTLSGTKIMDTLGSGIRAAAPNLQATATGALAGVAVAANLAVAPVAPAPSPLEGPAPVQVHASAKGQASVQRSGKSVIIQNLTVTLPGVQDADGFVAALQTLIAQHDGSGDESGGWD
jgi:TP901 family phage tail tape measure protein